MVAGGRFTLEQAPLAFRALRDREALGKVLLLPNGAKAASKL